MQGERGLYPAGGGLHPRERGLYLRGRGFASRGVCIRGGREIRCIWESGHLRILLEWGLYFTWGFRGIHFVNNWESGRYEKHPT